MFQFVKVDGKKEITIIWYENCQDLKKHHCIGLII